MSLGADFSGTDDLNPALEWVSGLPALGEAILRRLTTSCGTLDPEYPDYGYNLRELIGTAFQRFVVEQFILEQVLAEADVESAYVKTLDLSPDGTVHLVILVTVEDRGEQSLTIDISKLTSSAFFAEAA